MRTGQGFDWHGGDPTRPSTDWRTLEEIDRRTPKISGGGEVTHLPAATWLTPRPPDVEQNAPPTPFCIIVTREVETEYRRPGGTDNYFRTDNYSKYLRPKYTITVCEGDVYSWAFYPDANGNALAGGIVIDVDEKTWENVGDDSDFGVWLEATLASKGTSYPAADSTEAPPDLEDFLMDSWVNTQVKLSGRDGFNADWTQSSDLPSAILASQGKSYLYVGRVQIANDVVTITQRVSEDVFWVHPTFEDPA